MWPQKCGRPRAVVALGQFFPTMRILIVSGNPHIPQYSGGIESTTHDLALELRRRGHHVSVLCRLAAGGGLPSQIIRTMRNLSLSRFPADRWLGYPVYRQWDVLQSIPYAVSKLAPHVAIVHKTRAVRMACEIRACGVPVLFYFHDVDHKRLDDDLSTMKGAGFLANSAFTAQRYKELFGTDSIVIPPLFRAQRYIAKRKPANVTFINPIAMKGSEIAFKIAARCPEIPFSFIESWSLSPQDVSDIHARLAGLPNVVLRRRTDNMKSVYGKAKILLVPSICEEAWGRVATEAQFSGIPVVASDRGGLPESVGPGGILLDPDGPIEPWVDAVRRLWFDDAFYLEKSADAIAYSKRLQIDPSHQIDALLTAVSMVINKSPDALEVANSHDETRPRLSAGKSG